MLAVMGLNFLGDGLIDALDPKYRKEMMAYFFMNTTTARAGSSRNVRTGA